MDYGIKCEPGEINVTPFGYYLFALDYYRVAKVASAMDFDERINYPAYFLYCRSIELALKSSLKTSRKFTNQELQKHDFCKLLPKLDAEMERALMITETDKSVLRNLDPWYKTKEKRFEYFKLDSSEIFEIESSKLPKLPDLQVLDILNNKVLGPALVKFVTV